MKANLKVPPPPAEATESSCMSLAELEPGGRACLCGHNGSAIPSRLRDLGFVARTPIRVVRSSPLGDPVELEIRGYRICLRRAELREICVQTRPSHSKAA